MGNKNEQTANDNKTKSIRKNQESVIGEYLQENCPSSQSKRYTRTSTFNPSIKVMYVSI